MAAALLNCSSAGNSRGGSSSSGSSGSSDGAGDLRVTVHAPVAYGLGRSDFSVWSSLLVGPIHARTRLRPLRSAQVYVPVPMTTCSVLCPSGRQGHPGHAQVHQHGQPGGCAAGAGGLAARVCISGVACVSEVVSVRGGGQHHGHPQLARVGYQHVCTSSTARACLVGM